MLPLLIAGLLLLPSTVSGEEPSLPPGERPVKVHAGFFLVNLSGVSERSETFDADLYLNFRWQDSRLAFDGFEPRRFLEDAAVRRIEEMWWPHPSESRCRAEKARRSRRHPPDARKRNVRRRSHAQCSGRRVTQYSR